MAAVVASAALFFAIGGSGDAVASRERADSVADAAPCCLQVGATAPTSSLWALSSVSVDPGEMAPASRASRWRVVNLNAPKLLPVGVAQERGLQVKTILAARSISAAFPEIKNIGGVRPDALPSRMCCGSATPSFWCRTGSAERR